MNIIKILTVLGEIFNFILEYISKISNSINAMFPTFDSEKSIEIAEERLRKFYSPVFVLFREYLYADFSENELEIKKRLRKIPKLKPEEQFLIGGNFQFHLGNLMELIQSNANKKFKQQTYDHLCSEIDKNYCFLCRQFNIPLQDIKYTLRQKRLRLVWMFIIALKDAGKCTLKVLPIVLIFLLLRPFFK